MEIHPSHDDINVGGTPELNAESGGVESAHEKLVPQDKVEAQQKGPKPDRFNAAVKGELAGLGAFPSSTSSSVSNDMLSIPLETLGAPVNPNISTVFKDSPDLAKPENAVPIILGQLFLENYHEKK